MHHVAVLAFTRILFPGLIEAFFALDSIVTVFTTSAEFDESPFSFDGILLLSPVWYDMESFLERHPTAMVLMMRNNTLPVDARAERLPDSLSAWYQGYFVLSGRTSVEELVAILHNWFWPARDPL